MTIKRNKNGSYSEDLSDVYYSAGFLICLVIVGALLILEAGGVL